MAACVQVEGPITSIYSWQGKIEEDIEWRMVIKSTRDHFEKVRQLIKSDHPYDVPQIVAVPVLAGDKDYLNWLEKSVIK